ncbi:fibronectin type III domain-containing protein [Candidatus Azambacteria bacterium]|nr:fibronectin type III domain-containing protein [Candidatus Azambacteria bacterium]
MSENTVTKKVTVNFNVRDIDADAGTATPGRLNVSLEYCTNAPTCSTWATATAVTGDTGLKQVCDGSGTHSGLNCPLTQYTPYSIVWTPATDYANQESSAYKVRVKATDAEAVNATAYAETNAFEFDTKAPVSGGLTFDAGVAGAANGASVTITHPTDATGTQYMISDTPPSGSSNNSTPVTTSWTALSGAGPTARTWTFDSDIEQKNLYVKFRDAYGNEQTSTTTVSTIAPAAANFFVVQDVSNTLTSDWQMFITWETSASPSFASYKLQYATSTDNVTFSSYATANTSPLTVAATNYYLHKNLTTSWYYRYRLGVTDVNGNTTVRSNAATTAKPDGVQNLGEGGGGSSTPTITNVASSSVRASSATVTFNSSDTASLSSTGAVAFATQQDYANNVTAGKTGRDRYTAEIGNAGYITVGSLGTAASHSVTLTNLLKNQQYRYGAEACNASGSCGFEDAAGAGYTFTTLNGPTIVSGSIVATPSYDSASVTWKTDKPSDTIAFYATSTALGALVNPISVGSNAQVTSADGNGKYVHTVAVSNLGITTLYYYKVRSTDQNAASDSYTQYDESAIASFTTTVQAPPSVSAATCTTTDSTGIVAWTTDQSSTTEISVLTSDVSANYFSTTPGAQFVQYPSGTIDNASRAAADYVTAHSHTFSGLSESATYYVKTRSLNRSGGETSSTLTCVTTAKQTVGRSAAATAVDTVAPLINSVIIKELKTTSAIITWGTDELADSLVKYGTTMTYGLLGGSEELSTDHSATLSGLNPQTSYNFKVTSADRSGNRAYAGDQSFTTLSAAEEALLTKESLESLKKELEELKGKAKTQESLKDAVTRFKSILKSVSTDVSLGDLEEITTDISNTISDITQEITPPTIIGGVPQIDIEATKATIKWRTNKQSSSIIALVPQDEYNPKAADAYTLQVGQPEDAVTEHSVTIPNLNPSTVYHFQIRSKATVGPEGKSRDFVFETKAELPQIVEYSFKRITENAITVAWRTNVLSTSVVRYTPFDGTTLKEKESGTQGKPDFVKDHEVSVSNLISNTNFLIEISSADVTGATASKVIGTVRTTIDEKAPVISKVRSESTIFPGKAEKTQTIVYWETDEPSTSQIFWKEGVAKGNLVSFSRFDQEYTTSHVAVITSFTPGTVYRFAVESVDPANNKARSSDYTILTPKKGETVIDLIINNFQDIFGFLKKL